MKKWIIIALLLGLVLFNISAAFHGYRFTHFNDEDATKSAIDSLSVAEKASILLLGISHPRPQNEVYPEETYRVTVLNGSTAQLEMWEIPVDAPRGAVVLFHGYSTSKSSMLPKAKLLRQMGYSTYLVDFRGSGGSSGNTTTIGYQESEDVVTVVRYLQRQQIQNLYLLGTSMGSAAILKALAEESLEVQGLILECPYGSLLQTAKNRFETVGVPSFPAAYFLVLYGGLENGFWGFSHNPSAYSQSIKARTLLIFGEQDNRVKRFEIDEIYHNLKGEKELLIFPEAGHLDFLEKDQDKWVKGVSKFLR